MEGGSKIIFCRFFAPLTMVLVGFCFSAYSAMAADSDLIVTEIMFSDVCGSGNRFDWVELYNAGREEITIVGGSSRTSWRFSDDLSKNEKHSFPMGNTKIRPEEFIILAKDPTAFGNKYQDYPKERILKVSLDLPENKESTLAISNDGGNGWFSSTTYSPLWGAKENGRTLEKIDPRKNNDFGNWQESFESGGTPGNSSSKKSIWPGGVLINELFPDPEGSDGEGEFVELYNTNDSEVNLSGWSIENKSGDIYVFPDPNTRCSTEDSPEPEQGINAQNYVVLWHENLKFSLHNSGGEKLILKDPNGESVCDVSYIGSAKENFSYALRGNNIYSWTPFPTPGKANLLEEFSTAEKVYLSEILPNPKGNEARGEFIEIVNRENVPVDLYKWTVRDGSKTGKYIFKEHIILKPYQFFVIYRPKFKVALNNSRELVSLQNPQGKFTSTASYEKSSENISYNFDGSDWRWSKFLTPGRTNKFDKAPVVRIKKPRRVYKNIYTAFKVNAKDKETRKLKFVWDFGDGHKSYLKSTKHKYLKPGEYKVKLTVRDESQIVEKKFRLRVRKYPRPKIEIVELTPNPSGRDTEFETIVLKNNSKKEADLKDYKIATGSKNLYNHPILKNFALKPAEEKIITRRISRFALNNKAGKVQLVYPDGKIADETVYAKEKIKDDEIFAKIDGKWQWIASPEGNIVKEKSDLNDNYKEKKIEHENGEVLGVADTAVMNFALRPRSYTSEDFFIFLNALGFFQNRQKGNCCQRNSTYPSPSFLLIAEL